MSIEINDLSLSIGGKKICSSLNITFERGESWAVLGVNGVGKSTLLHQIIDINDTKAKEIVIDGKTLRDYSGQRKQLAQTVGILLQDYEYNFPCTVLEAVLIGRHPYMTKWQWEDEGDVLIAEDALKKTGLYELKDRIIDSLSGGEKRRLNLATLLVQSPDFLLLDEPTNHLDLNAQVMILDLIKQQVQQHNRSAVMVIHDANLANRFCENVLLLFGDGEWAAGKTKDLINVETLERLYGCSIQTYTNNDQTVYLPG